MATAIGSMLRAAARQPNEPLNVLTFPTHERNHQGLAKTNCVFYMFRAPGIKDWDFRYAPLPDNTILLDPTKEGRQIPFGIDFDLVLSQNKFGQFQVASQLARQLHLPLVSLEHTLPPDSWPQAQLDALKSMRGHINVFISEYSRAKWGWKEDEAEVVHHGVDTEVFCPNGGSRNPQILSVVNDWINRNWCCGFELWRQVSKGLPVRVVGDTPGLSKPAASIEELVNEYCGSQVFLNTSLVSPVPTVVLEAMACGCPVVSTANCMLPEVIEHGKNGFLSNEPAELASYCRMLLNDTELCRRLGAAARQTILDKFSMSNFVTNWNRIFERAAALFYKGE